MSGKIFIAVTGCKNGFSVLYTSPGLDRGIMGLSQTLDDMRGYLRVSKTGIDYYGLSFLKGYRVCSQYRSTVDSAGSSGGFIGISLIIPDNVQISSTRLLLNRLFEAYYTEHYNTRFGTPIPDRRENGGTLESILKASEAEIRVWPMHYRPGASNFGATPLYVGCGSEAQVDAIFGSPYQKIYLEGSRVIMLPNQILAQPQAFAVTFNTPVRNVNAPAKPASDRMVGRLCAIAQRGCTVSRLVLNGVDYTQAYSTICLVESDQIEFTVTLPNGKQKSFDGAVHKALSERILLAKEALFGFNFFPYDVAVVMRGGVEGVARANIFIPTVATDKETIKLQLNARGEGFFTIRAPFTRASLVLMTPGGAALPVVPTFLTESSDMRAVYPIDMRVVRVQYPPDLKGKANLFFAMHIFPVQLTRSPLQLLIPAAMTAPFELKIGRYRCSINPVNGIITPFKSSQWSDMRLWTVIGAGVLVLAALLFFLLRGCGSDKKSQTEQSNIQQNQATAQDSINRPDSIVFDEKGDIVKMLRWEKDSLGKWVLKELPAEAIKHYLKYKEADEDVAKVDDKKDAADKVDSDKKKDDKKPTVKTDDKKEKKNADGKKSDDKKSKATDSKSDASKSKTEKEQSVGGKNASENKEG